jgi:putative FmdB family regulatory protein
MPFYEYKCVKCKNISEDLRPIKSRDEVMLCKECKGKTECIISKFSIITTAKAKNISSGREVTDTKHVNRKRGSTAIRVGGGSLKMKDCTFKGFQTGISMAKGVKLDMDGNRFENVGYPIEVTDEK